MFGRSSNPEPADWLGSVTDRHVLVATRPPAGEGVTFTGVLVRTGPDGLVLTAAEMAVGPDAYPMAGEVFIPRSVVLYVQTGAVG